jgi:hypothetical protein
MALQMEGSIVAYPEDRDANRLNYTVSIYRLVLDTNMRTITKWVKATGCAPVSVPIGDCMNYGPGDSFIHTSQQFTIPFKANNVTYMDPIHLAAFNTLVQRYGTPGGNGDIKEGRVQNYASAQNNFTGLPWIDLVSGTNELTWFSKPEELVDPMESVTALANSVKSISASVTGTS